MVIRSTK